MNFCARRSLPCAQSLIHFIYLQSLLYVSPEAQGKGVARALVQWGIDRAREDGVPVYLEASVPVRLFSPPLAHDEESDPTKPLTGPSRLREDRLQDGHVVRSRGPGGRRGEDEVAGNGSSSLIE